MDHGIDLSPHRLLCRRHRAQLRDARPSVQPMLELFRFALVDEELRRLCGERDGESPSIHVLQAALDGLAPICCWLGDARFELALEGLGPRE